MPEVSTPERAKSKNQVERFKIDDLSGHRVTNIERWFQTFLQGWKSETDGGYIGFSRTIDGKKWEFSLSRFHKIATLTTPSGDLLRLTNVHSVEFAPQEGRITIVSKKNGLEYLISDGGSGHSLHLRDKERTMINRIRLPSS